MLDEFITDNTTEIIVRARRRVAQRKGRPAHQSELDRGVPLFLTQLTTLLTAMLRRGEEGGPRVVLAGTAEAHARASWLDGLSIGDVVHDYGDICQIVTELAIERSVSISAPEFRGFNRCLDDAIAQAVAEYERVRDFSKAAARVEHLGQLAHEIRNILSTAMLSWDSIRRGVAPTGGSVGALHKRSLDRLRDLLDRSLTELRLEANAVYRERVVVATFIDEESVGALIQADARGVELRVGLVDPDLVVEVDRQVLAGALANLLHNAFKFTRPETLVTLKVTANATRVYIEVEDECGGLPPGSVEELFHPYAQKGKDQSGLGLGLGIARRAVEANGGALRAHDLPSKGCCFTIDLERAGPAAPAQ